MTQSDKRITWKSRFEAWKASGLSAAAWCREQDVKVHQMYYWIQKFEDDGEAFEEEATGTKWLPIQVDYPSATNEGEAPVFIHFGSLSVEVRPGANMSVLSDVVDLLRKPC